MCHFEYTIYGCDHTSDRVASICPHMAIKVKPKVCFASMSFSKMANWVRVCTQFWGEKATRIIKELDSVCDECALKDAEVNGVAQ